ncbi:hypothetical protein NL108_005384 [Boleophthalmus pectinirostris]|nr:hypothetical protein NL108_005384 [Boleophthalmus pectinirostris]
MLQILISILILINLQSAVLFSLDMTEDAKADKPRAVLTAHGDTVLRGTYTFPNLTCSINDPDHDWTYEWFIDSSDYGHKFEEAQTISTHDVGTYRCRGIKQEPALNLSKFFTEYSNAVYIEEIISNKATIKVQNSEFCPGENISMTCEVNEQRRPILWLYEWKTTRSYDIPPSREKFEIRNASEAHSGEYWCRWTFNRYVFTDWSPPVTVIVNPKATVSADTTFLPAGGTVTLSCSVSPSSSGWKFYWYKDTQATLLQTTDEAVLNVSERGRYWCRGERGSPICHTAFSEPISIQEIDISSIIIGVVCAAVLLILFPLILCRYKKTREGRQNSNDETGGADYQNLTEEKHQDLYSDLLHSDVGVCAN